ncbi:hypothetical protein [Deinococcus geothermalis]|nr:hypothetical protein [Deinococcus geothermalis]
MIPDAQPTVSRGDLPRTDLQATKIGMLTVEDNLMPWSEKPLP